MNTIFTIWCTTEHFFVIKISAVLLSSFSHWFTNCVKRHSKFCNVCQNQDDNKCSNDIISIICAFSVQIFLVRQVEICSIRGWRTRCCRINDKVLVVCWWWSLRFIFTWFLLISLWRLLLLKSRIDLLRHKSRVYLLLKILWRTHWSIRIVIDIPLLSLPRSNKWILCRIL